MVKRYKHKTKKNRISSETATLIDLLRLTIVLPFHLIMYLLGKEDFKEVVGPFRTIVSFLTEARFTVIIISINVVMFVASLFFPSAWISMLGISPLNLFEGRWYTLITAGFLHADAAHLLGNMIFLLVFGRVLERRLGSTKTALIYFGALIISGVFSNLVYFIMGVDILGIGASGALMGLVAAGMLLDPFYITYFFVFPLPIMVVGWTAIYSDITGILTPMDTNIGHMAHMGGFLSITVLMYFFTDQERSDLRKGLLINLLSLAVAIILFVIISAVVN
ncbi:MAG: rhomboid family intramembrane serine protease [Candidatus Woesearchaeota archaeon]